MGLLTDVIRDKVKMHHEDEEKRRQQLRDFYHSRISERINNLGTTGAPDDPVLQQMTDQYLKLLSPQAKKTAQNGFDLVHKIKGAIMGGNGQPQQQAQGTTPDTASSGAAPVPAPADSSKAKPNPQGMGAPAAEILSDVDKQQAANGPASQEPQQAFSVTDQKAKFDAGPQQAPEDASATEAPAATASAKQQFNAGPSVAPTSPVTGPLNIYQGLGDVADKAQEHGLKLKGQRAAYYEAQAHKLGLTNPRDIAEYVGSEGQRLPTFVRPTTAASNHAQLAESFRLANNLPDTEEGHAQADELASQEEVRQAKAKGQAAMQVEWFKFPSDKAGDPPHAVRVNPKDPTKMLDASTGQNVPEGASQINPAIVQSQIRQNAYGQFGNLYRALKGKGYSDDDAQRLAGEQVEAEYQKRLSLMGAGNIREAMGQDENGHPITIPLQTTRVPNATAPIPPTLNGPTGSSAAPSPAAAGAPQTGGGAVVAAPAPSATPKPAPVANKPVPIPANLAPRMLPGVSPATARIAAQYSIPITESVTQLFGDEAKTGVKPLLSFAHLADDPEASKRLGKAINLTRASLGDGIADASVGGGAGGIHVSSGGFGTWLQNQLGVPGAIAGQNAEMLKAALSALTPEEREAYDATMSEMSVMAGLRSLSKSSAAVANIRLIENEIPKLGTAASSAQYLDQMQRIGNAIKNAVHTPGLFPMIRDPKTGKDKPVGISPDLIKQLDELPEQIKKMKSKAGPVKAPQSKNAGKSGDLKGRSTQELLQMLNAAQ